LMTPWMKMGLINLWWSWISICVFLVCHFWEQSIAILCFCYGVRGVEWCALDFFPFSAPYYLPLIVAIVVGFIFILTCGCQAMLTMTIWGVRLGVENLRRHGMVH
jgi:hypothetical protein